MKNQNLSGLLELLAKAASSTLQKKPQENSTTSGSFLKNQQQDPPQNDRPSTEEAIEKDKRAKQKAVIDMITAHNYKIKEIQQKNSR